MLEQNLEQDLKTAMLAGLNSDRVMTLRNLAALITPSPKSPAVNAKPDFTDDEALPVFSKEAKSAKSADFMFRWQSRSCRQVNYLKAIIEAVLYLSNYHQKRLPLSLKKSLLPLA
jgi:hypothetical protein